MKNSIDDHIFASGIEAVSHNIHVVERYILLNGQLSAFHYTKCNGISRRFNGYNITFTLGSTNRKLLLDIIIGRSICDGCLQAVCQYFNPRSLTVGTSRRQSGFEVIIIRLADLSNWLLLNNTVRSNLVAISDGICAIESEYTTNDLTRFISLHINTRIGCP